MELVTGNRRPTDIRVDIVLVQVYMPSTNHNDDEIEKLYEEISEILHKEGRGQVNDIVMEDFKSIVGE